MLSSGEGACKNVDLKDFTFGRENKCHVQQSVITVIRKVQIILGDG